MEVRGMDQLHLRDKPIGHGKTATVYCGFAPSGDSIALKVMKATDARLAAIVREEYNIVRMLSHPNIVRYFSQFEATAANGDTEICIVMEYCSGSTMENYLKTNGNFDDPALLKFLRQTGDALVYLHKNNIIHRDIKTDNILLKWGEWKLTDFGFSRTLDFDQLAQTFTGTPFYLAPELITSQEGYSFTVDYWSYGVLVYRAVVGNYPIVEASKNRLFEAIPTFNPARIPEALAMAAHSRDLRLSPMIHTMIQIFLGHLLQPNPSDRIQVPQFAAAIEVLSKPLMLHSFCDNVKLSAVLFPGFDEHGAPYFTGSQIHEAFQQLLPATKMYPWYQGGFISPFTRHTCSGLLEEGVLFLKRADCARQHPENFQVITGIISSLEHNLASVPSPRKKLECVRKANSELRRYHDAWNQGAAMLSQVVEQKTRPLLDCQRRLQAKWEALGSVASVNLAAAHAQLESWGIQSSTHAARIKSEIEKFEGAFHVVKVAVEHATRSGQRDFAVPKDLQNSTKLLQLSTGINQMISVTSRSRHQEDYGNALATCKVHLVEVGSLLQAEFTECFGVVVRCLGTLEHEGLDQDRQMVEDVIQTLQHFESEYVSWMKQHRESCKQVEASLLGTSDADIWKAVSQLQHNLQASCAENHKLSGERAQLQAQLEDTRQLLVNAESAQAAARQKIRELETAVARTTADQVVVPSTIQALAERGSEASQKTFQNMVQVMATLENSVRSLQAQNDILTSRFLQPTF
eukprot:m.319828 g.319828  ORF g.319828 m.319828 type:complete len:746 (-) comp55498_c0_seq1:87-2324(-)